MNYLDFFYQLLPEAVLVATALVLLAVAIARETKSGAPAPQGMLIAMSASGIIAALVALWLAPADADSGTTLLTIDPLARLFKGVLLGFGLLAVLLPTARGEMKHPGEYHALILFALTGLMLALGSTHLLLLFVALELASMTLYLLAGFSQTRRATEASLKYFLFGAVSTAFLLFGMSLIYGFAVSASLPVIAERLAAEPGSPLAATGLLMILVGLGFKLAAAPFHYWAPDVYEGAPATTVGIVAAASKVVAAVVMVRILDVGFAAAAGSASWGEIAAGWAPWLAVLAAVSMLFGNLLALAQRSVRRLLAYSAVANTGYLLVGLAAGGKEASAMVLFYVVVYGLATFGALAVTAAVERERGDDSRESFAGLIHRSPGLALALLVAMVSLAGIPPLAGFTGKFALFNAAVNESMRPDGGGLVWLVALGAVLSAVSLYYYLRVLKQAFVMEPEGEESGARLPMTHAITVAVPAVALVLLGLFPDLLLSPIIKALG